MAVAIPIGPQKAREIADEILGAALSPDAMQILYQIIDKRKTYRSSFKNFCEHIKSQTRRRNGQQRAKYRLQAVLAYPGLMKQLEEMGDGKWKSRDEFWAKVDEGQALIPSLRKYFEDKSGGHKIIENKHIRAVIRYGQDIDETKLATLARYIKIDHFPRTQREADLISRVTNSLSMSLYSSARISEKRSMTAKIFKGFDRKSYRMIEEREKIISFRTFGDMAGQIINHLRACFIHSDPRAKPDKNFYERKSKDKAIGFMIETMAEHSLREILDLNIQMHRKWGVISAKLRKYDEANGMKLVQKWAQKYPRANGKNLPALGRFTIVPLLSRAQLDEEHKRMDHCVDTYAPKCILGTSVVFSVRDEKGRSLSTFELDHNDKLVQHYAHGNAVPPAEISDAVTAYIEAIITKKIKPGKLYAAWIQNTVHIPHAEIFGYDKEPTYERAQIFFRACMETNVFGPAFIKALGRIGMEVGMPEGQANLHP